MTKRKFKMNWIRANREYTDFRSVGIVVHRTIPKLLSIGRYSSSSLMIHMWFGTIYISVTTIERLQQQTKELTP